MYSSYNPSVFTKGARHGGATDYAPEEHTYHRRLPVERPYGTHHRRLPVEDGDYDLDNEEDYYDHFVPNDYNDFIGEDGIFRKKKPKCKPNEQPVRRGFRGYKCVQTSAGCPPGHLKSKRGNCHPTPSGKKPNCPGGKARACWPKARSGLRLRGMRRSTAPFWTCKSTCKRSPKYVDFDYDV